jgi:A/G-specific adenine glycosylase
VSDGRLRQQNCPDPALLLTQTPPAEVPANDVLAWGLPGLRDLPWRRTRDAWAVLVSEVMLQQTQVPRVIPKWQAFLAQFPTPAACAAVPLGDVLRLWQGLGYPRRAQRLHATASAVIERHGGSLPASLDELLALPGIGPYTARAVLAFAFEHDVAVVDTNIARVLARVTGERLTPKRAQAIADSWVPEGDGWAWNQVLMDLGATLCRPSSPTCDACPLAPGCAWALAGRPHPDPAEGSAGVSTRQATFDGSDRQARGRLLLALTSGTVAEDAAAAVMQRPSSVAARLVEALVAEGLVVRDRGALRLP